MDFCYFFSHQLRRRSPHTIFLPKSIDPPYALEVPPSFASFPINFFPPPVPDVTFTSVVENFDFLGPQEIFSYESRPPTPPPPPPQHTPPPPPPTPNTHPPHLPLHDVNFLLRHSRRRSSFPYLYCPASFKASPNNFFPIMVFKLSFFVSSRRSSLFLSFFFGLPL